MRFGLRFFGWVAMKMPLFPHAVLREKRPRRDISERIFLLFVRVKAEHFGAGIYRKLHPQKMFDIATFIGSGESKSGAVR